MTNSNPFLETIEAGDKQPLFDDSNENYIRILNKSIRDKANYNLRQIISITKRLKDKVATERVNEYGETIEDWYQISTTDLIDFLLEGSAWSFYSTPIRMQSFIETSLAEIIFKDEYNKIISDPELEGTIAVKSAITEMRVEDSQFALTYRKLYTQYVTEILKSFDMYLKRVEHIIDMRQREDKMNPNNPFVKRED